MNISRSVLLISDCPSLLTAVTEAFPRLCKPFDLYKTHQIECFTDSEQVNTWLLKIYTLWMNDLREVEDKYKQFPSSNGQNNATYNLTSPGKDDMHFIVSINKQIKICIILN